MDNPGRFCILRAVQGAAHFDRQRISRTTEQQTQGKEEQ
jgi:hypothetical protein